jgi:hypothetical protein
MIASDRVRDSHETVITDLLPGTEYFYELVAFLPGSDIPQVLAAGRLVTDLPVQLSPVPNVQWLEAVYTPTGVALFWQNPVAFADSFTVRVVRNHRTFPLDPYDGMVVYQGDGETFSDETALVSYDQQFYTVFVTDDSGRWSSGAVVSVVRDEPAATTTDTIGDATTTPGLPPDITLPLLTREAIQIMQAGARVSFADEAIRLRSTEPFTIRIAREALPPHLKSVMVTLRDPHDYTRSFSFLLRLVPDQSAYEATLAPLGATGITQMVVTVYDLQTLVVGRYGKQVQFVEGVPVIGSVVFPDRLYEAGWGNGLFSLLLGMSAGMYVLAWYRRRREDNSPALP